MIDIMYGILYLIYLLRLCRDVSSATGEDYNQLDI
jgi:hypothetical protein